MSDATNETEEAPMAAEEAPAMDLDAIIDAHAEPTVEDTTVAAEAKPAVPTFAENAVDAGKKLAAVAKHPEAKKALKGVKKEIPKMVEGWTLEKAKEMRAEVLGEGNTRLRILSIIWNKMDEKAQADFLKSTKPLKMFIKDMIKMNALPGLGFLLHFGGMVKDQIQTHLPIPTETLRAWWLDLDNFDPNEVRALLAYGVLEAKGGETVAAQAAKDFATMSGAASLGARAMQGVGKVAGVAGTATGQAEISLAGKVAEKGGAVLATGADMMTAHIRNMDAVRAEVQKIQPIVAEVAAEVAEVREEVDAATQAPANNNEAYQVEQKKAA